MIDSLFTFLGVSSSTDLLPIVAVCGCCMCCYGTVLLCNIIHNFIRWR